MCSYAVMQLCMCITLAVILHHQLESACVPLAVHTSFLNTLNELIFLLECIEFSLKT